MFRNIYQCRNGMFRSHCNEDETRAIRLMTANILLKNLIQGRHHFQHFTKTLFYSDNSVSVLSVRVQGENT